MAQNWTMSEQEALAQIKATASQDPFATVFLCYSKTRGGYGICNWPAADGAKAYCGGRPV